MPQTTPNVYNAVPNLHGPTFDILTIEHACDDCNAGVHPAIPSGLTDTLNCIGWLAMQDDPVFRQALVAALPAFALLVWMSISGQPSLFAEWSTHHPQLRDLAVMLDPWLPLDQPRSISEWLQ